MTVVPTKTPPDIVEPTVEALTTVPLSMADRCDRCLAQAFVRVSILREDDLPSELLLCAHHYAVHEDVLRSRPSVIAVQDERYKINEKPS